VRGFKRNRTSEPATPTGDPTVAAKRSRGPRLLLWAALLAIVALVLAAGAGGWWLANQTLIASADTHPIAETAAPVSLDDGVTMPDIRGLARDDAAQVLADAGIPASAIALTDSPSAAPAGVIVTQTPAFGEKNPKKVTLGVATPATMPNLAGKTRADAITALSGLGVTVTVEFAYSRDNTPGTVIGSNPATGAPLAQDATITVAGTASTISLSNVNTLRGDCSTSSSVTVSGTSYQTAVVCDSNTETVQNVWLIEGKADRLTGTIGMPDTTAAGSTARVQILANGTPILDQQLTYGKTIPVDLPTAGVLQLAFVVTAPADTQVAFAAATLYGDDAAISGLKH